MDAKRIVAHLWIIFVLLPIVIYVLFLWLGPSAGVEIAPRKLRR
jgi:hypothetical protein